MKKQPIKDKEIPIKDKEIPIRVFRNGGWLYDASFTRVSLRNWYYASDPYYYLGFRIVRNKLSEKK